MQRVRSISFLYISYWYSSREECIRSIEIIMTKATPLGRPTLLVRLIKSSTLVRIYREKHVLHAPGATLHTFSVSESFSILVNTYRKKIITLIKNIFSLHSIIVSLIHHCAFSQGIPRLLAIYLINWRSIRYPRETREELIEKHLLDKWKKNTEDEDYFL